MGRLFRWLFALGVLAVIAGACTLALLIAISGETPGEAVRGFIARIAIAGRQDDLNTPIGTDDTPIRFTVSLGDSPAEIANNLAAAGMIDDTGLFVNYARAEDLDTQFQAGTYFVRQTQPLAEIARQLTDARASFIPFRILEGWRLEEIAEIIDLNPMFGFSGAEFVEAAFSPPPGFPEIVGLPSGANLEGFLYPNTYQLPPDTTPDGLIQTLTDAFLDAVDPQMRADITSQGLSVRDVVSLAAIVQREAVHVDEMPLIAGVYRNRLDIGMRLEADPTVQYALGNSRDGVWWPRITAADYSGVVSPYNVYLNFGLPPGPIASPGLDAIRATIYPTESDFLYFRADCRDDGYHEFALTFEEHLANGC